MENQDRKEGEEGGRTICVDGDDIEFSGPLLVTYLRLEPLFVLIYAPAFNVTPPPQGPPLSVLLKDFGKRRDLNCNCVASALVFCLKSFACKTRKDQLISLNPDNCCRCLCHDPCAVDSAGVDQLGSLVVRHMADCWSS